MSNQELQVFLDIIDKRVKKFVNENKILKQYCGVITNFVEEENKALSSKYKVRLLGDKTEFTFLNKTGEKLEVGDYVYIQTVGNDLNTGVITYKTRESLNNVDYIIEEGVSGIWTYEKWASGKAVCWGVRSVSVTINNLWQNGVYIGDSSSRADYPFTFKEIPLEIATLLTDSYSVWQYCKSRNTTSTTGDYNIARFGAVNSNQTFYFNFYVVGKWK